MDYQVKLRIDYDYASPAVGGRHVVCLLPQEQPGAQWVRDGEVTITPTPSERIERLDFFGNQVTEFAFRGAHDRISIAMQARVRRSALSDAPGPSSDLSGLGAELAQCMDMGPQAPVHFLAPSTRVPLLPELLQFARGVVGDKDALTSRDAILALGRALHDEMTFDATATNVDTPMAEAFEQRRGVCQDFSHIMIGCLRALGIPAGYVSGYLRTLPPPGKPRLEGVDAMHAWVRAWGGGAVGWIEYDPTNACQAGDNHIVAAYGRDYSDVVPVKGAMRIAGRQKSKQSVDVVPI